MYVIVRVCVCVCVCVCVRVSVRVNVHMYVLTHGGQKLWSAHFLYHSPSKCLSQGIQPNWSSLIQLDWLFNKQQRISVWGIPNIGITWSSHYTWFLFVSLFVCLFLSFFLCFFVCLFDRLFDGLFCFVFIFFSSCSSSSINSWSSHLHGKHFKNSAISQTLIIYLKLILF